MTAPDLYDDGQLVGALRGALAETPGSFSCPECGGTGSARTHRTDCKSGRRDLYIEGLRMLAAELEAHPEVPLPYSGNGSGIQWILIHEDSREVMATIARAMPARWNKHTWGKPGDEHFELNGKLAGLSVEVMARRDQVCTRKVTGTETREVEEIVTPAETRMVTKEVEVVEWECGSLLAPRPAEDGAQ